VSKPRHLLNSRNVLAGNLQIARNQAEAADHFHADRRPGRTNVLFQGGLDRGEGRFQLGAEPLRDRYDGKRYPSRDQAGGCPGQC
jgi:hypothetical protein